jgi:hypothetical protein
VAAIQFVRADNTAGVLLSLILLAWLIVVGALAVRTDVLAGAGVGADGDGGLRLGNSRDSAATLARLETLGFIATFMATGLTLFGPLLMLWAFLL